MTLTHDPKLDDPALEVALRSDCFYIGSLGSRRINAAVRGHDEALTYSRFINGLSLAGIEVDRKVLADIAVFDKAAFAALADKARASL